MAGHGAGGEGELLLDSGSDTVFFVLGDSGDGEDAGGFVDDDEGLVLEDDGDRSLWGCVVEMGYWPCLDTANHGLGNVRRVSIDALCGPSISHEHECIPPDRSCPCFAWYGRCCFFDLFSSGCD